MPPVKVLITDHPWPDLKIEERILSPLSVKLVDAEQSDEATLTRLASDVVAIATCWAEVTAPVIKAAKECRLICRMGIGLNNIDIAAATALEIPVTNVPDYCIEEVADHTMGMVLSLARNIAFFHARTKQGEYDLKAGDQMRRLRGQRLGLIGFGQIGREVYQRAIAFGLDVVATSPSGNDYGTGCRMVSFDELIQTSHIISLHAPLTPETEHLLGEEQFAQMQNGVFIINTSRGPLIDPKALTQAVRSGKVGGAGLDVFEPEPPDLNDELYQFENVIVTPHAAFVSQEAVDSLRERVAEQIAVMLSGRTPGNVVNGCSVK